MQPTHRAGNILDVILTNAEDFHDVQTLTDLPFGLQLDHFMVLFSIITQNLKIQTKEVFCLWDSHQTKIELKNNYRSKKIMSSSVIPHQKNQKNKRTRL